MTTQATDTPAAADTERPAAGGPDFKIDPDDASTWPKVGTVYTFEVAAGDRDPRTREPAEGADTFARTVSLQVECPAGRLDMIEFVETSVGASCDVLPVFDWNREWAPYVVESRLPEPETVAFEALAAVVSDVGGDIFETIGVDVDQIAVVDRKLSRKTIDKDRLFELQQSVDALGQLQNIIVRRTDAVAGKGQPFVLIAGYRRLLAAKDAGRATVVAKVLPVETDELTECRIRLAENLQHAPLGHLDVATELGRLRDGGMTVAELAREIHKSDDFVRERLKLLDLAEPVRELVAAGVLPSKQAAVIARLKDPDEQIKVAARALGAWAVKKTKTGWRIDGPMGTVKSLAELAERQPHKVLTIAGVADEVAGKLGDLAGAGAEWPKDIEYAKRPPCAGCEHNSATSPSLFADAAVSAAGSGGHCADKACFQGKRRAWGKDPKNVKAVAKKKAAKKAADQAAGGRAERAGRKNRIFPESPAEHLACLTHAYGVALSEAIVEFVERGKGLPADAAETALAVIVVARDSFHDMVYLDVKLPAPPAGKLAAELAADKPIAMPAWLAIAAVRYVHSVTSCSAEPAYLDYNGCVENVPTPPAAIERIQVLEALAERWKVPAVAELVRADRKAAWYACRTAIGQRWTAKITGARKSDDVIAAINECDDVAVLRELVTLADSGLGARAKDVAKDRIEVLATEAVGITGGVRLQASKRIAAEKNVAVLVAAQDLGLTGDLPTRQAGWRRAAVAKRIEALVWPAAKAKKKKKKRRATESTDRTKGAKAKKAKKAKKAGKAKKR